MLHLIVYLPKLGRQSYFDFSQNKHAQYLLNLHKRGKLTGYIYYIGIVDIQIIDSLIRAFFKVLFQIGLSV